MTNIKFNQISAARKAIKAELVLKNCKIVNVFNNEIECADVAIQDGLIVGIGNYTGIKEIDINNKYLIPGLIDGHIHIESSMVSPLEFERAVVSHGTTCIITDPHEIANVAGIDGIEFMMNEAKKLNLKVKFVLPSCVPSTDLDETGARLDASDLLKFYQSNNVVGLAEVMNSYGTILGDPSILAKISDATNNNKIVDGHAPLLRGDDLNAYICAGVQSDHECTDINEAKEKFAKGQWIMIREGTAAHNLDALMPLFNYPYNQRCMLVTDDKHPQDLIHKGHIDYIIREAIKKGANPIEAIKMATINPAKYFKLDNVGAIAPNYIADLVVIDNLEDINVQSVFINGKLIDQFNKELKTDFNKRVMNSFNIDLITKEMLDIKQLSNKIRVIELIPNELLTNELEVAYNLNNKLSSNLADGVDLTNDILKAVVFERHNNSHHIGIGFIKGYGLKKGAVATSVAHDSHNLLVIGTNDDDIIKAANAVITSNGGLAISIDNNISELLELPIAGIMSNLNVHEVEKKLELMKTKLYDNGVNKKIDPFMSLSFISLPVIPKLRLNTYGLIDTQTQSILDLFIK